MQYFVSAENSSYFYWQLELLIESFLMHGLEDKLVIGLAENNNPKIRGFSSNLVNYGTKFIHENEGEKAEYLPINRVESIRHALAYGILKYPFVLIHADMILKNPISLDGEEDFGIIVNNLEELENDQNSIKNALDPFLDKLADERSVEKKDLPVLPLFSFPIVFNKPSEFVSDVFFSKLQMNMIEILKEKGSKFPCERAAWELTLIETFQHCSIKGKFLSASMMSDIDEMNFIHYKTGVPPVFHKKFFKFDQGAYHGDGPYEVLMDHNPTINTNYVQSVIKSYKKRNG
jgi:hypothetical protein